MIALNDLPGVAQVAMQGGKHAAGQIKRRLAGQPTGQPFKYFDKGSMATISRFPAVAAIGSKIRFSGFIAWLMWLVVHVMYLIGFKNRFTTMLHWAVSFLFRGRSQRTTTRQQIVARTLMARLSAVEEELKRVRGDSNGDRPSPEEAQDLEGGTVLAESAEPKGPPGLNAVPVQTTGDHPPGTEGRRGRTGAVRRVVPSRPRSSRRFSLPPWSSAPDSPGPASGAGPATPGSPPRHSGSASSCRRSASAEFRRWCPSGGCGSGSAWSSGSPG